MYITEYEIALRLFIACVFGGIVGFEREKNDSPAGFRTHILVSLGSALIMILSMYGFNDFVSVNKDPARLAAQVVSGIGFLGAGTILRDRTSVKGLTTAASLWVVAAIGLAAGAGFYFSSFFVTLLVFITLERSVETYFFRNSQTLKVVAINGTCKVKEINRLLEAHSIVPQNISMTLLKEEHNRTTIQYKVRTPFRKINMEQIIEDINEIDGIYSAEQEGNSESSFLNSCNRLFERFKRPNKPSM
ncbi:MgtC/SapB family protein [Desulfosporosinus sp.]|uniref:MgtC/SapB family protein n=1 Tax=Desulfosporosinus sp. TaxID=157907 RepID=UPI00232573E6|nr:MgtC/SapB family protein [Desulfosporosinus sp.]MDA8223630.1 MgtC/SapB family protein [Desulfitobacterium hafniense]